MPLQRNWIEALYPFRYSICNALITKIYLFIFLDDCVGSVNNEAGSAGSGSILPDDCIFPWLYPGVYGENRTTHHIELIIECVFFH